GSEMRRTSRVEKNGSGARSANRKMKGGTRLAPSPAPWNAGTRRLGHVMQFTGLRRLPLPVTLGFEFESQKPLQSGSAPLFSSAPTNASKRTGFLCYSIESNRRAKTASTRPFLTTTGYLLEVF